VREYWRPFLFVLNALNFASLLMLHTLAIIVLILVLVWLLTALLLYYSKR
jgi:hypothetical protein